MHYKQTAVKPIVQCDSFFNELNVTIENKQPSRHEVPSRVKTSLQAMPHTLRCYELYIPTGTAPASIIRAHFALSIFELSDQTVLNHPLFNINGHVNSRQNNGRSTFRRLCLTEVHTCRWL